MLSRCNQTLRLYTAKMIFQSPHTGEVGASTVHYQKRASKRPARLQVRQNQDLVLRGLPKTMCMCVFLPFWGCFKGKPNISDFPYLETNPTKTSNGDSRADSLGGGGGTVQSPGLAVGGCSLAPAGRAHPRCRCPGPASGTSEDSGRGPYKNRKARVEIGGPPTSKPASVFRELHFKAG